MFPGALRGCDSGTGPLPIPVVVGSELLGQAYLFHKTLLFCFLSCSRVGAFSLCCGLSHAAGIFRLLLSTRRIAFRFILTNQRLLLDVLPISKLGRITEESV